MRESTPRTVIVQLEVGVRRSPGTTDHDGAPAALGFRLRSLFPCRARNSMIWLSQYADVVVDRSLARSQVN